MSDEIVLTEAEKKLLDEFNKDVLEYFYGEDEPVELNTEIKEESLSDRKVLIGFELAKNRLARARILESKPTVYDAFYDRMFEIAKKRKLVNDEGEVI